MIKILIYTSIFILILSCNNDESNTNDTIRLNNKWMLNKSIYQNVSQNLSNYEKQGYIHFLPTIHL